MKENKEIEDILKEKFDSFEPPVPEGVWANIQNGMGATTTGTSSGIFSTTIGKVAAGLVATGLVVGSVYLINEFSTQNAAINTTQTEIQSSESTETALTQIPENPAPPTTESKVVSVETSEEWDGLKPEGTKTVEVRIKTITKSDNDPKAPVYKSVADMHTSKSSRAIITMQDLDNMLDNNGVSNTTDSASTENITLVVEKPDQDGKPYATIDASVVGGKAPLTVDFTQNSSEGKIKWVFGDGTISHQERPSHTFEKEGSYVVSLIVESDDGEIAMDEKVINVDKASDGQQNEEGLISVINQKPNVFTPNGDGNNDYMMVGAENMEAFHFALMDFNTNKIIFETNDPGFKWDGTLADGSVISKGTYVYIIRARGKDGAKYDTTGSLSVQ